MGVRKWVVRVLMGVLDTSAVLAWLRVVAVEGASVSIGKGCGERWACGGRMRAGLFDRDRGTR